MTVIISGTDGVSDVDGTAGTPALRGTDANTGIFFGADIIGFSEGGAECARFNADAQFVAAAGTASLPVITTTGDVNTGIFFPAADNIGFATNGVIRGRWTTDGLCFGSDTAAANALDDYEEGTWTPSDASGAGLSFSNIQATYTKIGRMVYAIATFDFPSTANGSTASIGGLPFTVAATAGAIGGFITNGNVAAAVRFRPANNGTTGDIRNGTGSAQTNATLSTGNFTINALYFV